VPSQPKLKVHQPMSKECNRHIDRMHGLDWYDYSARQYDAALGQFTSMDPLCEKYYHISPYAYCAGNPVKYVDPDGCQPDSLSAAEMSALAYGPNQEYLDDLLKNHWHQLQSFSSNTGFKSTLFGKMSEDGKTYVEFCLAFAGTDVESGIAEAIKDGVADVTNFLGTGSLQHWEAISVGIGISREQDKEITFTGHSLGGGLAQAASAYTGRDAIVFNSASLCGAFKRLAGIASWLTGGGNVTHYRAYGDYVNCVQDIVRRSSSGNIRWVKTDNFVSHSLAGIINAFKKIR